MIFFSLSILFLEKPSIKGGLDMIKENTPLLSDDFLDEVAKEINQMFGGQNQSEEYSLNEEASI
jgi:hypothetical protein